MIGERIKIARAMAGLSQRDLAERIQVSAMAISKYERGQNRPGSAVLIRLADALGVGVEYFLRPVTAHLTTPMYRRRQSLSEQQRERIIARVQEWVERYIETESLLNLSVDADLPGPFPVASLEDAEQAALRIRDVWQLGLGPIENLMAILEDRGIKVGVVDGPDEFDALTLQANSTIQVIVVRRDQPGECEMPGDRQRFCLAHELGHLVMHLAEGVDPEKAAHRFAGALLVPQLVATAELGEQRHRLALYELHLLKHRYGLSMQAWIYRAKDLGILSPADAARIFAWFRGHGWNRIEPGNRIGPEEPQRLKQLVVRALAEDIISPTRAEELLGKPLAEFWREEAERHGGLPLTMRD